MDPESGADGVRNVGITAGRIAALSTEALRGTQVIDVRGLVVAPGFIDVHAHGQELESSQLQAQDGVTTALERSSGRWPWIAGTRRATARRPSTKASPWATARPGCAP
jgi:N-acyl-D-glutamate deacylase